MSPLNFTSKVFLVQLMLPIERLGPRNRLLGLLSTLMCQSLTNSALIRTIISFNAAGCMFDCRIQKRKEQIFQNSDHFSSLVNTNMATMSIDDL